MNEETGQIAQILRDPDQIAVLQIILIAVGAWVLIFAAEWIIPWLAERFPGKVRLYLLPSVPVLRLVVMLLAAIYIVPLVIEPTMQNLVTIMAAAGLALGFAFKDYVSSLIAGIIAIYERPYRPGDWIRIDDAYGEVRALGLRAFQIVTPDDTVVTIPHAKIWDTPVYNDNDGQRDLMCVASFYLEPEHDAGRVRQVLHDVALTSPFLQVDHPIAVIVAERPWYTHYRLKAYPIDGRDQFQFTSDLTVRGKDALAAIGVRPAGTPGFLPTQPEGS